MKKLLYSITFFAVFTASYFNATAQSTVIYYESFGSETSLDAAWATTISTANFIMANPPKHASVGYTIPGTNIAASGGSNFRFNPSLTTLTGTLTLTLSTTGYKNIQLGYGALPSSNWLFPDSVKISVSADGVNYTPVSYTDVPYGINAFALVNGGTLASPNAGSLISLPSLANNQSTLYIKWYFTFNGSSGSYYIDDVTVVGTPSGAGATTGIADNYIQDSPNFSVYPNPGSGNNLNVNVTESGTLSVVDLASGVALFQSELHAGSNPVILNGNVSSGVYLLQFVGTENNFAKKYIVK